MGRKTAFRVLWVGCIIVGLLPFVRADSTTKPVDSVRTHLDNAKAVNLGARKQAADTLRAACDAAIASANKDKKDDLAAQIKTQKDAFTSGGTLPSLPALKQPVEDYRAALDLADSNLLRAFARAIRQYAAHGESSKAIDLEGEKTSLFQQHGAAGAGNTPGPTEAAQTLAQAKTQYKADVDNAQQALLAKIDVQVNNGFNAGDLPAVQALQKIEDALKTEGLIPDNAPVPAVAAAATNYRRAIRAANIRVATAYTQAIRDLTRARQVAPATAAQTEFTATGLSGIDLASAAEDNGSSANDTTFVLAKRLPDLLTTTDRWEARENSIFVARRAFIRSKAGGFLNRDFACDIWFTVESTGTYIFVGIGAGVRRRADGLPANSLSLAINSPDNLGGLVGFVRGDGEVDPIGHLGVGEYVARIQKLGNVLTLSVGDEDADGTFNPQFTETVSDASVLAPFMTDHDAHLFFGGGRFWKFRYILGKPPTAVPDTVVKALVGV